MLNPAAQGGTVGSAFTHFYTPSFILHHAEAYSLCSCPRQESSWFVWTKSNWSQSSPTLNQKHSSMSEVSRERGGGAEIHEKYSGMNTDTRSGPGLIFVSLICPFFSLQETCWPTASTTPSQTTPWPRSSGCPVAAWSRTWPPLLSPSSPPSTWRGPGAGRVLGCSVKPRLSATSGEVRTQDPGTQ